jgi:dienelactone hydrolase
MRLLFFLLSLLLFTWSLANSQTTAPAEAAALALTPGTLFPHLPCAAHPEQSYTLYLPADYSSDRRWPLVISSDPGAEGSIPLELQKSAADQLGYVLVSSNNSRNGPWKPFVEATDATLTDVQTRVSIDIQRIYFAGFSGGARASSELAAICKCSAGVLLSGAGFSRGRSPARDSPFPVFSAVGLFDFNYPEVIELQQTLSSAGYPHWLRIFDGAHEWAPAAVMEEAFAWFRFEAMKQNREPRDQSFIDAQFQKAQARAASFEQSGELLNAWREYLQMASAFDTLEDVASIRGKSASLGKDKSVRDAAKRERNEFAEQSSLTADIETAIANSDSSDVELRDNSHSTTEAILHLRQLANQEKRPEKARVYKRALSEVFIMSMETGRNFLDSKSYRRAIPAFDAATQAHPDSAWAWSQLAVAYAESGKNKQAISALRQARQTTHALPKFDDWLKSEPAFERLRSTPEFQTIH